MKDNNINIILAIIFFLITIFSIADIIITISDDSSCTCDTNESSANTSLKTHKTKNAFLHNVNTTGYDRGDSWYVSLNESGVLTDSPLEQYTDMHIQWVVQESDRNGTVYISTPSSDVICNEWNMTHIDIK